jgi:hypothetical protein
MSRTSLPVVTSCLLRAALAAHPYRDAILGDLDDECAQIEAAAGADEARRWYRGEVRRSLLPIVSTLRLAPPLAVRLLAMVLIVYVAVVRLAGVAALEIERVLGTGSGPTFVTPYLAVVAIVGGIGGFVVSVAARKHAFVAALSMAAVTVIVGIVHLFGGAPNELWFRCATLLLFVLGVTVGECVGTVAAMRSTSSTRPPAGERRQPNR